MLSRMGCGANVVGGGRLPPLRGGCVDRVVAAECRRYVGMRGSRGGSRMPPLRGDAWIVGWRQGGTATEGFVDRGVIVLRLFLIFSASRPALTA